MKRFLDIPSLYPHKKGYRITFDALESSPEYKTLSKEGLKTFEELYCNVQKRPKKHFKALKQLSEAFPHVPEIANLLTFAYLKLKKQKKAEALIEQTYHEHPHHLSARINYADLVVRRKKIQLVPDIIPLNTLNEQRESFHYTEFRGLMVVMGFYYLATEECEKAQECYELAFQVDPLHPSVATLEKKLQKNAANRIKWVVLLKKCVKSIQNLACISKNP